MACSYQTVAGMYVFRFNAKAQRRKGMLLVALRLCVFASLRSRVLTQLLNNDLRIEPA
jgi:hypothetical protein